jgi:hypothetical protein
MSKYMIYIYYKVFTEEKAVVGCIYEKVGIIASLIINPYLYCVKFLCPDA